MQNFDQQKKNVLRKNNKLHGARKEKESQLGKRKGMVY